jgi:hypothetical protein
MWICTCVYSYVLCSCSHVCTVWCASMYVSMCKHGVCIGRYIYGECACVCSCMWSFVSAHLSACVRYVVCTGVCIFVWWVHMRVYAACACECAHVCNERKTRRVLDSQDRLGGKQQWKGSLKTKQSELCLGVPCSTAHPLQAQASMAHRLLRS